MGFSRHTDLSRRIPQVHIFIWKNDPYQGFNLVSGPGVQNRSDSGLGWAEIEIQNWVICTLGRWNRTVKQFDYFQEKYIGSVQKL